MRPTSKEVCFVFGGTRMRSPLTSRPPYGKGRPRTPQAEAQLPEGGPTDRGLPLDDKIPGYRTFSKPVDDQVTHPKRDEPVERVRNPRDMAKDRSRIDVTDQSDSKPNYYGLGQPYNSPKTKYPYRDDKPNTHNASVEFVAGLWLLRHTASRLLRAGSRIAADLATMATGLNPKTIERAKSCAVTLKRADIKNLRWLFSVNCGNGAKVVKFKAARPGNVTKFQKMDFHVSCSCPAWRWQGPEFHSTTKDYQDPKTPLQGTASPPDIRDPERVNKICKHVAAVLEFTKDWSVPKPKKMK